VIAFYVAFASYLAWPTIVYQHGRSRAALDAPTSVANHGEMRKHGGSPTEQMSPALAVSAALPESHELTWVTVLLPARVYAGPSINTPIIQFYAVGTPLHATRYWNDWIEVKEPDTSKSGWIYRKYLGAISNYEQGKIKKRKSKDLLPGLFQPSVTRKPFQLSIMRAPLARRSKQPVSSRRRLSVAEPKWLVCCSAHLAATER